jgi:nicotinate-nucleotide--dimethylbenzimidazole phosphoribosyltransferase
MLDLFPAGHDDRASFCAGFPALLNDNNSAWKASPIMPQSLEELRKLLSDLPEADTGAIAQAQARNDILTKPQGALGRLEDLTLWMASWQQREIPELNKVQVLVFAGNHGVVERGVSAFPSEVTVQMVANFAGGGAAINQLCKAAGAELDVLDIDLDKPTADFTTGPAMGEDEFLDAVRQGMSQVSADSDLVCIGEMGIGNTTVAAALSHAVYGGEARDWTGRGTGVDDAGLDRKTQAVADGIAHHADILKDPLQVARCLGGRELAAMAGAALAARLNRTPLLIDGYVASAALAPFQAANDAFLGHCQAAHVSAEPGHTRLLKKMGLEPLLNLGMRLGEASGAATAIPLLRAAVATHAGMATFADAGVTEKSD